MIEHIDTVTGLLFKSKDKSLSQYCAIEGQEFSVKCKVTGKVIRSRTKYHKLTYTKLNTKLGI